MFLNSDEIRSGVMVGRFRIEPFDESLLKPASYVLRLSDQWREWIGGDAIDVWSPNASIERLTDVRRAEEFCVSPGELVLGATLEAISLPPDIMGLLMPLSHLARFGLSLHLGACLVGPNYGSTRPSRLTLELASSNPCPLRLRSGMPVCHLLLARVNPSTEGGGPLSKSIYERFDAPSVPMLYEEMAALATANRQLPHIGAERGNEITVDPLQKAGR